MHTHTHTHTHTERERERGFMPQRSLAPPSFIRRRRLRYLYIYFLFSRDATVTVRTVGAKQTSSIIMETDEEDGGYHTPTEGGGAGAGDSDTNSPLAEEGLPRGARRGNGSVAMPSLNPRARRAAPPSATRLQQQLSIYRRTDASGGSGGRKGGQRPPPAAAAAAAADYDSGYESTGSFAGYDSDYSPVGYGGNVTSEDEESDLSGRGIIATTFGLRRRRQRKRRRKKRRASAAAAAAAAGAAGVRTLQRRVTTEPLQLAKANMRLRAREREREREKEEFLKRHQDVSSYSLSNYGEAKPKRSNVKGLGSSVSLGAVSNDDALQDQEEKEKEKQKQKDEERIVLLNCNVQPNSTDPDDIEAARFKLAQVGTGIGYGLAGCFNTNTEIGGVGAGFLGNTFNNVKDCIGGACMSMYVKCCFCCGLRKRKRDSDIEVSGDADADDADDEENFRATRKRKLFRFCGNDISTSKYTLITFLPIFLYEVFSRAAYLYFLLQAGLTWWQEVSPFSPVGSNVALIFVVVVSGVKAVLEDFKRHREDAKVNNTIARKVELEIVDKSGGLNHKRDNTPRGDATIFQFHHGKVLVRIKETVVRWRDIKVGDMLRVNDDEEFPADMLCLHSSLPEKVCFIKTTNLDGESNLKIRSPPSLPFGRSIVVGDTVIEDSNVVVVDDLTGDQPDADDDKDTSANDNAVAVLGLRGNISCEPPNANLHVFKGSMEISDLVDGGRVAEAAETNHQDGLVANAPPPPAASMSDTAASRMVPISMDAMLLRGCTLKHTGHVIGCVVYTGRESRIMKNAAKTPLKVGSFDLFLNVQIIIIVIIQILLCLGCALAGWYFLEDHRLDYYLAINNKDSDERVNGIYETPGSQIMVNFVTFWILFSYLIPISLFVSMEIVKFVQGTVLINSDQKMIDPASGQCSLARNSNINEDLGKVEYIFSDKTGTLTSNEMQLRQLCIGGHVYGNIDFKVEECSPDSPEGDVLRGFDPLLADAAEFLLSTTVDDADVEKLEDEEDRQRQLFLRDLGIEMLDTFMVLTVCHSLIVEDDGKKASAATGEGGEEQEDEDAVDVAKLRYQGPSPDEVAIVDACKKLGFVFVHRSSNTITFRILGELVSYEILNVLEFTSERQRMSVIARAPDGTVRLYMKGADSRVQSLLAPPESVDAANGGDIERQVMAATDIALMQMSSHGLRTMMLATKVIPDDEYEAWDDRYQDAAATIENREELMSDAMEEIEQNLTLVGATGIEDKLQDGVPDAVKTLIGAGIKVWMITGDKQETAINIAVSCGLVNSKSAAGVLGGDPDASDGIAAAEHPKLMICNASSAETAASLLEEYMTEFEAHQAAAIAGGATDSVGELVIDGKTLNHILNTEAEWTLAELASQCRAVVVCRASPRQKAAIVRMIMGYTVAIAKGSANGIVRRIRKTRRRMMGQMLAIGDGANDVAMIQAADIGVGIFGKEGRQAVNNSDYAIGQFRFLVRLLLVHGSLSHYRLARLIKYSFYKNIAFGVMFFYYQFYCGFSGQAVVGSISAALYNVVLTSLPILFFAVIDKPVSDTSYIVFPKLYNQGKSLNMRVFWKSILMAIVHSAICFFIPMYSVPLTMGQNEINDLYSIGNIVYTCLLITVNLEIAIVSRFWTIIFTIFVALSILPVWLLFLWIAGMTLAAFESTDLQINGAAAQLCSNPNFWFAILLTTGLTFGTRLIEKTLKRRIFPDDDMIVSEHEQLRDRYLRKKVNAKVEMMKTGYVVKGNGEDDYDNAVPGATRSGLHKRKGSNGDMSVQMSMREADLKSTKIP